MTVPVVGVDGYGLPLSAGATGRRCNVRDDWVAARRLSSAFHSGAADNFLSAVFDIDTLSVKL